MGVFLLGGGVGPRDPPAPGMASSTLHRESSSWDAMSTLAGTLCVNGGGGGGGGN